MFFLFILIGWIFSVCLHEFAHAAVAYLGGDVTVKDKGYLTLNPLKYTDPLLSVGLPVFFLLMGGLGLPGGCVYIERSLLRSRGWDCAVSLAGPAANLVLAGVLSAPFYLGFVDPASQDPVWEAIAFLVLLQFMAVGFNLIPVPPLDGYRALSAWFSYAFQARMAPYSMYGLLFVFALFWFVDPVARGFFLLMFLAAEGLGVPRNMAIDGLEAFQVF